MAYLGAEPGVHGLVALFAGDPSAGQLVNPIFQVIEGGYRDRGDDLPLVGDKEDQDKEDRDKEDGRKDPQRNRRHVGFLDGREITSRCAHFLRGYFRPHPVPLSRPLYPASFDGLGRAFATFLENDRIRGAIHQESSTSHAVIPALAYSLPGLVVWPLQDWSPF
jgi:hypothetical protein